MDHETTNPPSVPPSKTFVKGLLEWFKIIVIALVIALPIRFYIAEPFIVQGASMDPTFSTGQFLIVDRLSYRFENPHRGDVIVFEYPINPSVYYIKRIIGLPGETVEVKHGAVTIKNKEHPEGFELKEPYIDASHISADNLLQTLGPTQYFVMGDNRAQSSDSRMWGPLNKNLIVGRPFVRLTPIDAIGVLPGDYQE